MDDILKHKPMFDELNQRARELDRKAALPSQTAIEQTTRNINERWNVLTTRVTFDALFLLVDLTQAYLGLINFTLAFNFCFSGWG